MDKTYPTKLSSLHGNALRILIFSPDGRIPDNYLVSVPERDRNVLRALFRIVYSRWFELRGEKGRGNLGKRLSGTETNLSKFLGIPIFLYTLWESISWKIEAENDGHSRTPA